MENKDVNNWKSGKGRKTGDEVVLRVESSSLRTGETFSDRSCGFGRDEVMDAAARALDIIGRRACERHREMWPWIKSGALAELGRGGRCSVKFDLDVIGEPVRATLSIK